MDRTTVVAAFLLLATALAVSAQASSSATAEIRAAIIMESGDVKLVARHTFFVLPQSYESILNEVIMSHEKPSLNAYIESLSVSDALKAWMKDNRCADIELPGENILASMWDSMFWFRRDTGVCSPSISLTAQEVMTTPEFLLAYYSLHIFGPPRIPKAGKNRQQYLRAAEKWRIEFLSYYDESISHQLDPFIVVIYSDWPSIGWTSLNKDWWESVRAEATRKAEALKIFEFKTDLSGRATIIVDRQQELWLWNPTLARVARVRIQWSVPIKCASALQCTVELSNDNALFSFNERIP